MPAYRSRVRLDAPPRELVDAIVASLASDSGWSFGRYEAEHKASGVSVWFGNELYGMHIETETHRYGNVVMCGWLHSWRRRLYRAIRQARLRHPEPDALRKSIAALYGCKEASK